MIPQSFRKIKCCSRKNSLQVPRILFLLILLSHAAMLGGDFDKLPLLSNSCGRWFTFTYVSARVLVGLLFLLPLFASLTFAVARVVEFLHRFTTT